MENLLAHLKPLVGALLMPLPLFLGLTLLGLGLLAAGRRRWGWRLVVIAWLGLALAAWRPVADGLLGPLENRYPALTDPWSLVAAGPGPREAGQDVAEPDAPRREAAAQATAEPSARHLGTADAPAGIAAIVVLGGGWWPNDQWPSGSQLSDSSAQRLLEGVRLARALPAARLILTGADRQGEIPPVALGYAQAARELGIAPERIQVLDTPVDTAQEARAVRAVLAGDSPLILVTSAAHLPRAMRHFQALGLDPIPAPTQHLAGRATGRRLADWLPSASHLRKTEAAWHEYLGLLAWRWDQPR
ncbi:MAG TPA: ElyC/SanA/YdcF family protein [Chromatiaceae bacterium]|nr:ElyC/SanA/YdcF family protein [Chromatiaceae bacterium]